MNKTLDIIHHTAIQMKDVSKALIWYTGLFACEVEYQDNRWSVMKFANTFIALVLPGQHLCHFAIIEEDLSSYGSTTLHHDSAKSVYIKDYDESNIEVLILSNGEFDVL